MSTTTENARHILSEPAVRILMVPGFVVDTYSTIEQNLVDLAAQAGPGVEFLWLVPDIGRRDNLFSRQESRQTLKEPVWVTHLRQKNIPYVVGNVSRYNAVSNFVLFRNIFRMNRIDAVYTHFGFERFWAALLGKLLGKVTIWNEHWHSLGRRHARLKRWFYRLFVDDFISISRFITNTLPAAARVHTIPNAIRVDNCGHASVEQRSEGRRRLGIAQEATVVLMVAAFRPEKRHKLALEICRRALAQDNDLVFVFLGEGSLRARFAAEAKERGLAASIVAPGHVDNVADYYSIADVFMFTSDKEPFGYVVLEAMRCALPVIAFDSGGPAEVIRDGESGLLVRDGDVSEFTEKLLGLANSSELRTTIGENALRAVQQEYNREKWIGQLNATLKEIVTRRKTPLHMRVS